MGFSNIFPFLTRHRNMLSLLILAAAQLTAADIPKANTFMSDSELDAFVTEARTKHSPGGSDPLWLVRMANK